MTTYEEILDSIPSHLKRYVVDQNYERYTPVDQAAWRFTLNQLKAFLSENAHEVYESGLKKTGISIERIPKISDMSEKLQQFGWVAVPVSGFIPPAAFMEMQSLGILPIASDMRSVDHILYTPAPDIVHEAAGHAPILVDEQFASYLKKYAQVAKKAIVGKKDLEQYEAIRVLSDVKEDPNSTKEEIQKAEDQLQKINAELTFISEAAKLGRMNWWTAEYGLIGDLSNPKIFGAGLLSSIGESKECLKNHVEKVPLSLKCIDTTYDITEPQPQLFVTDSFENLHQVLDEMAEGMAFRKGGVFGLEEALQAETVNTVVLDSGLQFSGQVVSYKKDDKDRAYFVKLDGPSQLALNEMQLNNHGKERHPHGFSTPLGPIKGKGKSLFEMTPPELESLGIAKGKTSKITFESGITVEGEVSKVLFDTNERALLITWTQCTSQLNGEILFEPSWGEFDMATGSEIISVFGGPADRDTYGGIDEFAKKVIPPRVFSENEKKRHQIYFKVREWRESDKEVRGEEIASTYETSLAVKNDDWLLYFELYELALKMESQFSQNLSEIKNTLRTHLEAIKSKSENLNKLISMGLSYVEK